MRDFSADHSALALNTATLGHNLDGHGAGWPVERVIDACAERGIGGIVFWRREIGARAVEIGERVRAAGMQVTGLCRTPFLVGPLAPKGRAAVMEDVRAAIDMAAGLGAPVLTIVVGGVEPGTKGLGDSLKLVADRVAEAAPFAAERGVKLALEPLNPVYGGNRSCLVTMRDAVDLCEAIGAPNVGVAVDVYHVWWDTDLAAPVAARGGGTDLRLSPLRLAGGDDGRAAGPRNDGRWRGRPCRDPGSGRGGRLCRTLRGGGVLGGQLVAARSGRGAGCDG